MPRISDLCQFGGFLCISKVIYLFLSFAHNVVWRDYFLEYDPRALNRVIESLLYFRFDLCVLLSSCLDQIDCVLFRFGQGNGLLFPCLFLSVVVFLLHLLLCLWSDPILISCGADVAYKCRLLRGPGFSRAYARAID